MTDQNRNDRMDEKIKSDNNPNKKRDGDKQNNNPKDPMKKDDDSRKNY